MFDKNALEPLKRITYLIVSNVIDTRFEHSVAQIQPFFSHSSLRLVTSFWPKGNDYPEPFPHQPMWTSLAANQYVTARQQAADPARRTRFFPMSYLNNKHVVRLARSKPYIQILALSKIIL